MRSLRIVLKFLFTHPLTRRHKMSALWRFVKWQFATRILPYPFVFPYVGGSKLLVEKGMSGATGNVYAGLHEFEDMAFTLHMLRPGDLFADIGSNIGAYTILASGAAGAKSLAVEPIPSTFRNLKNNVSINHAEELVSLHNVGVGASNSVLKFTKNNDTINHVVLEGSDNTAETIDVPVVTLDELFRNETPVLMKMDVEGFELEALKGATNLMRQPGLQALIIEINGTSRRYGITEQQIHDHILSYGFTSYRYAPMERKIERTNGWSEGNTIYIRDEKFVTQRISSARKYKVLSYDI